MDSHPREGATLKKGTCFAGTWTVSPVLGLRPFRALRPRARKLPKPRISTPSLSRKASVMHLRKMLTTASVCHPERGTLSATLAASSDFVISSAPAMHTFFNSKAANHS